MITQEEKIEGYAELSAKMRGEISELLFYGMRRGLVIRGARKSSVSVDMMTYDLGCGMSVAKDGATGTWSMQNDTCRVFAAQTVVWVPSVGRNMVEHMPVAINECMQKDCVMLLFVLNEVDDSIYWPGNIARVICVG